MDTFNWLIAELLMEQHQRLLDGQRSHVDPERLERPSVRRALASAFVRLGLRLDPAAGEGVGALTLSTEGRRSS